ncbi:NUDIX hydrolase [bacterium]|nr:NUDIX hydrolase [bacterium]
MTERMLCAGGIVLNTEGKLALVMSGPKDDAFWGFPKGHVDAGEDVRGAAQREIEEETGLTHLTFVRELGFYERFRGTKGGGDDTSELKEIHMFLFRTDEMVLAPNDEWNPEARWVSVDEALALITHPKDRAFCERIRGLIEAGK